MKSMVAAGAHARAVESVYPSSTYPAHATIVTGVLPAKHGIHANTVWTEQGSSRDWHWYAKSLKARTLWQAAQEKGLKVAITYWPTTVGARADLVLGEIWDPDNKDTVKRLASAATPGLLTELMFAIGIPQERIATDRAAVDNFVSRAAAHVFRKHKPNLQLVHLLNCDEVQHKAGPERAGGGGRGADAGREHRPDPPGDRRVGRRGPHGAADRGRSRVHDDHAELQPEHRPPGCRLHRGGERQDQIVEGDHPVQRRLGGGLPEGPQRRAARDRGAAGRVQGRWEAGFQLIGRSTLDRLGYNPDAVLALDPAEGWAFTERLGPTTPTVAGNHGQLPSRPGLETGFIAEGAGVRPGVTVERMRLVDIAPTVAAMLDLELDDIDGHIRRDILSFSVAR
jgi:hypothetical protein